ncbi:uncharacterized protein LOC143294807 [Babylonia areolata]|uniref:uncharacterized protein LOC143294807 n=1 Tax=Babylonia areolata TaxID=304850 RepID=UPI003FD5537B
MLLADPAPSAMDDDFIHSSNMDFVSSHGLTLAYLVLLMACGVVGNTLVFLVYYHRFKPSVTRTYILAMSVCDLMTNCLALPSDIYEIRFHYDFDDDAGCKFFGFLTRFLALLGAAILVAIAVDRRRKMCQLTNKPRTLKYVYVELTCVGVFAASYASPFGVLRGLQTIPVNGSNFTGSTCSIDDVYVGSLFFAIYNASTGLAFIICVSIMAVCYALIARHLWMHRKRLIHNAMATENPGPAPKSRQPGQGPDKSEVDDRETAQIEHDHQAVQQSTSAFTVQWSEDEEFCKEEGKFQISITEDSEHSCTISDLENTTTSYNPPTSGMMTSSLTSISETEQELPSVTADVSTEGINPGACGSKAEKGATNVTARKLTEAAMVANARKCQAGPSQIASGAPPRKARKHGTKASDAGKASKKMSGRTTLVMFVLAVMFVISYLPYLLMAALYRGKDLMGYDFWLRNLHQIALRSFFINSAVNPLVYSFCSIKFRKECRLFLCRK